MRNTEDHLRVSRGFDSSESRRQRADLVHLEQDAAREPLGDVVGIGCKQIVSDNPASIGDRAREASPQMDIVRIKRVFQKPDRISANQVMVDGRKLLATKQPARKLVSTVGELQVFRRYIQADRDIRAHPEGGYLLRQLLQQRLVGLSDHEAARRRVSEDQSLVGHPALDRMVDRQGGPDVVFDAFELRNDHDLLKRHIASTAVNSAAEHVDQRMWHRRPDVRKPAHVAKQRLSVGLGAGTTECQGQGERDVGPCP